MHKGEDGFVLFTITPDGMAQHENSSKDSHKQIIFNSCCFAERAGNNLSRLFHNGTFKFMNPIFVRLFIQQNHSFMVNQTNHSRFESQSFEMYETHISGEFRVSFETTLKIWNETWRKHISRHRRVNRLSCLIALHGERKKKKCAEENKVLLF